MAQSIKVKPGKSTEARIKAQAMANRTGKPVSLLQPFAIPTHTGRLRTGWTTYDTVYPNKAVNPRRNMATGGLIPAKIRVGQDGRMRVFVNPKYIRRRKKK